MTFAEGLEGGRGWVQPADASLVLAHERLRLLLRAAAARVCKVVVGELALAQQPRLGGGEQQRTSWPVGTKPSAFHNG